MKRIILLLSLFVFVFPCGVWASPDGGVSTEEGLKSLLLATAPALYYLLPATAAGMTLLYHDTPGALQFGKSFALTVGVTYGLKHTISETRPNGDSRSFPSGHTAISFSSAEFIRKRYGCAIGCPAYVVAAFVGYSRIESREHFLHDVLAGAAIGIVSSTFFTHPYKSWHIIPEGNTEGFGILLTRLWD